MKQEDYFKIFDWWFYTIFIAIILFVITNIVLSGPDPNTLSLDTKGTADYLGVPEVNQLTVSEQRLVWQLSQEELGGLAPKIDWVIRKQEALQADFDHDGDVDLVDMSMFSKYYSDWQHQEPAIVLPESQTKPQEFIIHWPNDPIDPCFIECLAGVE